ncbi:minor tail protein [Rhodococcus phage NiceHouse]|nr:minor tail protein [Rhodococcus phage NiceHouse]
MITHNGQSQLLKLVSGKVYRFADLFAVGASGVALPASATQMDFGWATCAITDSYVDEVLQQVVFHGTLPAEFAGNISEIGLVSQSDEFIRTGLPNALVYAFEPKELWFSNREYDITNLGSVGENNYKLATVAVDDYLAKVVSNVNISRYDTAKIRVKASKVSTIRLTLKNDELNYAYKDFTLAIGDNTLAATISTFTKVGSFNPNEIFEIRFTVQATAASNDIEFDALNLSSSANGGLVARSPLAVTQYKRTGATMELEYAVAL